MRNKELRAARGVQKAGFLDIGSSKIACLIAEIGPQAHDAGPLGARVIGIGHCRSQGVRSGLVIDLDQAEDVVGACISQAERMAGITLDEITVSLSCGRIKSLNFAAKAEVDCGVVGSREVARLIKAGNAYVERDGRALVHMNRVSLRLDGSPVGHDPRGMAAHKISADLHAVTADETALRNLSILIDRCHLDVEGMIVGPYASGLAATSEEERRLGVTCVDIGGGATTISVFAEGRFIHAHAIPVGSDHVTYDIARALQTRLAEAERIKALYGTLLMAQSDEQEVFCYPPTAEDEVEPHHMTKAQLAQIIRPRFVSLMTLIEERLSESDLGPLAGSRFVFTGGGSQIVGLPEFAANQLGRPVRTVRPFVMPGLPQSISGGAFSNVVGQLLVRCGRGEDLITLKESDAFAQGYLERVGQWLMESF